jgi:hypothetical protein
MNSTSQALLATVLNTDSSLSAAERGTVERLIAGQPDSLNRCPADEADRLLVTQKAAANLLSVSRITIWRMTRDGALRPVEVLPGTWRYRLDEIEKIAGSEGRSSQPRKAKPNRRQLSAA